MDNLFNEINDIVKDFQPPEDAKPSAEQQGVYIPISKMYSYEEMQQEYQILMVRITALQMMNTIRDIPDEVIIGWLDYVNKNHGKIQPDGTRIHGTNLLMSLITSRMDVRGL
jgi:hypothetical protein